MHDFWQIFMLLHRHPTMWNAKTTAAHLHARFAPTTTSLPGSHHATTAQLSEHHHLHRRRSHLLQQGALVEINPLIATLHLVRNEDANHNADPYPNSRWKSTWEATHQEQTPFATSPTIVFRHCTLTKLSLGLRTIGGFNVNGGAPKWNQKKNKPLNNQSRDETLVQSRNHKFAFSSSRSAMWKMIGNLCFNIYVWHAIVRRKFMFDWDKYML